MNAAYAEIRGGATPEAVEPEAIEPEAVEPEPVEPEAAEPTSEAPTDEPASQSRRAEVADNLVRIGFLSGDARRARNPAVDVLATLLPSGAQIGICLTCRGVKSNGQYKCRETSDIFRAMMDTRRPMARTTIVLCTHDELSWTASQYVGQRRDNVTLYSIPFDDILGAAVRGHKRDVVEVWIADEMTVSVHTRPHEGDALCEYIERAVTSD